MSQGQITGLGGVFIKFKQPKAMNTWYKEVLGMNVNDYGVLFAFNHTAENIGFMQLGTFEQDTNYFGSPTQQVMLNFRVVNLEDLLERLKKAGVELLDDIETYDYGKFVHISDPEGNRIELWEPLGEDFSKTENYQLMS